MDRHSHKERANCTVCIMYEHGLLDDYCMDGCMNTVLLIEVMRIIQRLVVLEWRVELRELWIRRMERVSFEVWGSRQPQERQQQQRRQVKVKVRV